jgi:predicted dehydrogenase
VLELGLIGCAHIHVHDAVAAIEARGDVRCAAVWDPEPGRAAPIAARLGAPVRDLDAILGSPAVAAVLVLSETAGHPALIDAIAAAGKDLFVEKPLAIDPGEAAGAAARIAAAGVRFDTGYFLRELPTVIDMRDAVAAGSLGRIVRSRGRLVHDGALRGGFAGFEWMLDRARAGWGGLGDLGVHLVDAIGWITGQRAESASAIAGDLTGAGIDDHGAALLSLDGGAIAAIEAGWVERAGPVTIELHGTGGSARLRGGDLEIEAGGERRSMSSAAAPASADGFNRFFDVLAGRRDRRDLVPAAVAADHCAVIDACYRSARSGRRVSVDRG